MHLDRDSTGWPADQPKFRYGSRLCRNIDRAVILLGYDSPVLWREDLMKCFVEGVDRGQSTLFPDWDYCAAVLNDQVSPP